MARQKIFPGHTCFVKKITHKLYTAAVNSFGATKTHKASSKARGALILFNGAHK